MLSQHLFAIRNFKLNLFFALSPGEFVNLKREQPLVDCIKSRCLFTSKWVLVVRSFVFTALKCKYFPLLNMYITGSISTLFMLFVSVVVVYVFVAVVLCAVGFIKPHIWMLYCFVAGLLSMNFSACFFYTYFSMDF